MRDLRGIRLVASDAITSNPIVSGTIPFLDETEGPASVAVVDATSGERTRP